MAPGHGYKFNGPYFSAFRLRGFFLGTELPQILVSSVAGIPAHPISALCAAKAGLSSDKECPPGNLLPRARQLRCSGDTQTEMGLIPQRISRRTNARTKLLPAALRNLMKRTTIIFMQVPPVPLYKRRHRHRRTRSPMMISLKPASPRPIPSIAGDMKQYLPLEAGTRATLA
jgi:hypothetical protein